MRTKELLAAAKPFEEADGTVNYLVSMIKCYEAQLGYAAVSMKGRMAMLENIVRGTDGFSYIMRGSMGDAGSEIDVIQSQIFDLACTLQVVLSNSHGIEVED